MEKYEIVTWCVIIVTVLLLVLTGNPWFLGIAFLLSGILWILDSAFSGTIDPIEDKALESIASNE